MHTSVMFRGHMIDIEGTYIPGEKAIITADPYYSSPGVNPTIEDATLYFCGEDVTDLLQEVAEDIVDMAVEEVRESSRGVA